MADVIGYRETAKLTNQVKVGQVLGCDVVKPPTITGVLHVINDTTEGESV